MADPNIEDAALLQIAKDVRKCTEAFETLGEENGDLSTHQGKLIFLLLMADALAARLGQYPETTDVAKVWTELSVSLNTVRAGQTADLLDPRLYRDGRPSQIPPDKAAIMGIAAGVYDLTPDRHKNERAKEIAKALAIKVGTFHNFRKNLTRGVSPIKSPIALDSYEGVIDGTLRINAVGNIWVGDGSGPSPVADWLKWLKRSGRSMV